MPSPPSPQRVQAITWLLLPPARLRTWGKFGKHTVAHVIFTGGRRFRLDLCVSPSACDRSLPPAWATAGPSLASPGTTFLEIWSPTVRRRQTPPWVPSIWVEPLCLGKQCELHMRISIPREFGAKTQIVFMPQKSIIQHEFPLKLGLELSTAQQHRSARLLIAVL